MDSISEAGKYLTIKFSTGQNSKLKYSPFHSVNGQSQGSNDFPELSCDREGLCSRLSPARARWPWHIPGCEPHEQQQLDIWWLLRL